MSSPQPSTLRIATRASALALWQANHIAARIAAVAPETTVELVQVTTTGDRDQSGALRAFGGLGVFTREVQKAVLDRRADLAVHSLKDLPTETAAGLCLAAVPEREETADALVLPGPRAAAGSLDQLRQGARIGTGSLRRRAQLLHLRPDLVLEEVRGNVETRISKLDAGDYDALVLAVAGLKRLGLERRISARLEPPTMFAAVGQGALGIECREDDRPVRDLLLQIEDRLTRARVAAERALLAQLRAGCHAPVGAASNVVVGRLTLEAVVLSADGRQRIIAQETASVDDALALGVRVADRLLAQGAQALIRE
ncbi:MAG TPA: hydroxymethylbilane synthase [Planctomycetaceae bacterium]|nr:hydroxymethylbilane synthase [Planctomycetaceae bacterium]